MTDKKWVEVQLSDAHDFEEEEELEGILSSIEPETGPNKSMLYTIEKEDGEKISVWGSTVLDGRLKQIKVGQEIKIEYLGEKDNPKSGRTYKDFKVYIIE